MALIKFGLVVVDARGKLGGHVFTKSRKGSTLRTKTTPTNPQTTDQQNNRQIFGTLSAEWANLGLVNQKAWNSVVGEYKDTNIFGDLKEMAGRDLYIMINRNLITAGEPTVTQPPIKTDPLIFELGNVRFDVSGSTLEIDGLAATYPNHVLVLWATPPMSPGRFNFSGQYRQIMATSTYTDTAGYLAYVEKYGTPTEGKAVGIQVTAIGKTDGIQSAPQQERTIV